MSQRDATFRAMEEVSGLVISIALILASVFIPVALVSGIQGRLNKQFAVTIAISVVISAFNALTLSPALSALLLRPRKEARGPLAGFFGAFNRWFEKATHGYVNVSHGLIRKGVIAVLILGGFGLVDGFFGNRLPTSFLPDEDYGYLFLNIQLPPAASLERTDQVSRKVESILKETKGVQFVTSLTGFSLLNRVSASYNGFCFVSLRPLDERKETSAEILKSINARLASEVPEAMAFAFGPPAIPGLGNSGGFSFWLQDRSGGGVDLFLHNLQRFFAAARQRPELAGVGSQFSASSPQIFVDVDRDKVLKQGVAVADVYQTMQAYLGGLFLNQFNRFGRQWRGFLQAVGDARLSEPAIEQYYVRNNHGSIMPLVPRRTTRVKSGAAYYH